MKIFTISLFKNVDIHKDIQNVGNMITCLMSEIMKYN